MYLPRALEYYALPCPADVLRDVRDGLDAGPDTAVRITALAYVMRECCNRDVLTGDAE